jgi:hypothetical protein
MWYTYLFLRCAQQISWVFKLAYYLGKTDSFFGKLFKRGDLKHYMIWPDYTFQKHMGQELKLWFIFKLTQNLEVAYF